MIRSFKEAAEAFVAKLGLNITDTVFLDPRYDPGDRVQSVKFEEYARWRGLEADSMVFNPQNPDKLIALEAVLPDKRIQVGVVKMSGEVILEEPPRIF